MQGNYQTNKPQQIRKNQQENKKFPVQLSDYQILGKVGEGTYGKVYIAQHKRTKEKVALKKIKLQEDDEGVPSTSLREISILKEMNHPALVKLHDCFSKVGKDISKCVLVLVFEYVQHDLKEVQDMYGNNKMKFPKLYIKKIMHQMLKGIEYMHKNRIIHRDLKPQNILIDKQLNVKICDFGLARSFNIPVRTYTHEVVTLWYRAPEILLGSTKYSTPVDIWSLGCIFAELMLGYALFPGDCELDELVKIFQILGMPKKNSFLESLPYFPRPNNGNDSWKWETDKLAYTVRHFGDPFAIDLLQKMLVYDPSQRITASEAVKHPYFTVNTNSNFGKNLPMVSSSTSITQQIKK